MKCRVGCGKKGGSEEEQVHAVVWQGKMNLLWKKRVLMVQGCFLPDRCRTDIRLPEDTHKLTYWDQSAMQHKYQEHFPKLHAWKPPLAPSCISPTGARQTSPQVLLREPPAASSHPKCMAGVGHGMKQSAHTIMLPKLVAITLFQFCNVWRLAQALGGWVVCAHVEKGAAIGGQGWALRKSKCLRKRGRVG